jgi:hypothetical protein
MTPGTDRVILDGASFHALYTVQKEQASNCPNDGWPYAASCQ